MLICQIENYQQNLLNTLQVAVANSKNNLSFKRPLDWIECNHIKGMYNHILKIDNWQISQQLAI